MASSNIDEVRAFRKRAIANGYSPIPVRTRCKLPSGKKWQLGESVDRLLNINKDELNTGILTAGLRCFDIDVDDQQSVETLAKQISRRLPRGAIIRRRGNSPRSAILYRAAHGQPGKRSIGGPKGKVEVLGAGQQIVAAGLHLSGASIYWSNGRGPDTVPCDQLPAVTEDQIDELLNEFAPLLGSTNPASGPAAVASVFEQPGPLSNRFSTTSPAANDLSAGIESVKWFELLTAQEKSDLVQACLDAIDNRTDDPRERWLRIIFAVADAGRLGCPDARELALKWSRRGCGWTGEADFDMDWSSTCRG
jgi:hypothetical protein